MALIRYLHYNGGILVKTHRNGIEVGVVTSKRNKIRSTALSGNASQMATTSSLFDSQNPPLIKALLTAIYIENVFGWSLVCLLSLVWLKLIFFYSKCKITWLLFFYFFFNLIEITNSFRQRYIYLLKLVKSLVMVITPILVVNLGLFSIDK